MAAPRWIENLIQDMRYGARQLRSTPGFTAVAVASLALGIGANTAIFQLVDAVRLRTLPVKDPQELAFIDFAPNSQRSGSFSTRSSRLTSALWQEIRSHQEAFSITAAESATRFDLTRGGESRYAEGLYVTGDYFQLLGVGAMLGRAIGPEDDKPGCGSPGAVLSHAFWQREFGGAPSILTKNISLNGRDFPIIGVTPPAFFGLEVGNRFEVILPACADALLSEDGKGRAPVRNHWWLTAIGRLKPGWTAERATSQLQAISPAIMQGALPPVYRPDQAKRFVANKLIANPAATGSSNLRRQYESPLWLLLATTGLVLLIACANLANLLLARASVREKEIAVRLAIGASRGRLIRQLLSESLMLAAIGAALGAAIAQIISRGLMAYLSTENNPLFVGLGLDFRVLGFTAALAVGTCLLFGLLPALRATRIEPASTIRSGGRGLTSGRERFSARRALVVAQVALSLVLLVGALLFVRSLRNLLTVDMGFQAEGIISVNLDTLRAGYTPERRPIVFRQIQEQLAAKPGVLSASRVAFTPVSGSGWNERVRPDGTTQEGRNSQFNRVGPEYFRTMGTPLVAGREFNERDTSKAPKVAIVNEVFAKRIFGDGNPVGRYVRSEGAAGQADPIFQVVGVVKNTKYYQVREDFEPICFVPMGQEETPGPGATYVLRIAGRPADVMSAVKAAVIATNPSIALEFRILSQQLEESLLRERLMAALSGAFGLLAGLLATLGLYGVIAYMVARRRNEIGVRIALGADRGRVIRLVLREAWILLTIGMVVGVGLAIAAARTARSLLFGLEPHDPVTIGAAAALLGAVALLASYGPARRAAGLEPMAALREE